MLTAFCCNLISTQTNQKTDIATNNEEDAWMRAKLFEDGSNLFLSFIISSMKIILPKADRGSETVNIVMLQF